MCILLDAAGGSSEPGIANRTRAWTLQAEWLHTARLAAWESQLVTLWCNEDGIILTSSKADKHSILLKALVTCGIRTEAGQSSKTVDQSQSLQHSSELKMSD